MTGVSNASVHDQERAIENWAAHWSTHDMGRLLPLFTEDVVYEDVTMGVVNRGTAQLRAFGEAFFSGFPDVTFELQSKFANGTRGALNGSCGVPTQAIYPECQLQASASKCAARRFSNSPATRFDAAPIIGTWPRSLSNSA
jgi:hypothetical protein